MATEALLKSAQHLLDIYFQDYAPEDAFFSVEDFAYWVGTVYDKDVDDIARLQYSNSFSETGTGQITFSPDFLISKEFPVIHKDGELYAQVNISAASFTYDSQNSGVQEVFAVGKKGNCGECIRTTYTELWKLKLLSYSNKVWWFYTGNRIEFKNNSGCYPQKIKVVYVPSSADADFKLPKSREFDIATRAWALMAQARQGTIPDQTNNGNKLVTTETEIDKSQLKIVP